MENGLFIKGNIVSHMLIQKYGGTSLGNFQNLQNVVQIIRKTHSLGQGLIVVTSAMSQKSKGQGTSSQLIRMALRSKDQLDYQGLLYEIKVFHEQIIDQCFENRRNSENIRVYVKNLLFNLEQFLRALREIREISNRSMDRILRVGEKLSASILTALLQKNKLPAIFVSLESVIQGENKINSQFYELLEKNVKNLLNQYNLNENILVITGFIGELPGGILGHIGRGYTDYTAGLIGSVFRVKEVQIWKEVDGLLSGDPKVVTYPRLIKRMTMEEAVELTYFGAEVVHPFAIEKSVDSGIPIRIKNIFNPKLEGSLITQDHLQDDEKHWVKAITSKRNICLVNIRSSRMIMVYGYMADVFQVFQEKKIVVDLVTTSEVNISLTVSNSDHINEAIEEIQEREIGKVCLFYDRAIVSLIGSGMKKILGIAGRMFDCLSRDGINIEVISQVASQVSISCVIHENDVERAICILHRTFIEKED